MSDKIKNAEALFETKFIRVFDLQMEGDRHYYSATRREKQEIVAVKSREEFKRMLPDAVSMVVIIKNENSEPRLLLSKEFRYPAGQFLLSVPAGLIDKEDRKKDNPVLETARRELKEETGIELKETDEIKVINPFLFSTPGMTDESNALVKVVVNNIDLEEISSKGAVGSECFDGFLLLTKKAAEEILAAGVDDKGLFYSVYTWAALMYFISDICK